MGKHYGFVTKDGRYAAFNLETSRSIRRMMRSLTRGSGPSYVTRYDTSVTTVCPDIIAIGANALQHAKVHPSEWRYMHFSGFARLHTRKRTVTLFHSGGREKTKAQLVHVGSATTEYGLRKRVADGGADDDNVTTPKPFDKDMNDQLRNGLSRRSIVIVEHDTEWGEHQKFVVEQDGKTNRLVETNYEVVQRDGPDGEWKPIENKTLDSAFKDNDINLQPRSSQFPDGASSPAPSLTSVSSDSTYGDNGDDDDSDDDDDNNNSDEDDSNDDNDYSSTYATASSYTGSGSGTGTGTDTGSGSGSGNDDEDDEESSGTEDTDEEDTDDESSDEEDSDESSVEATGDAAKESRIQAAIDTARSEQGFALFLQIEKINDKDLRSVVDHFITERDTKALDLVLRTSHGRVTVTQNDLMTTWKNYRSGYAVLMNYVARWASADQVRAYLLDYRRNYDDIGYPIIKSASQNNDQDVLMLFLVHGYRSGGDWVNAVKEALVANDLDIVDVMARESDKLVKDPSLASRIISTLAMQHTNVAIVRQLEAKNVISDAYLDALRAAYPTYLRTLAPADLSVARRAFDDIFAVSMVPTYHSLRVQLTNLRKTNKALAYGELRDLHEIERDEHETAEFVLDCYGARA